MLKQVDWFLTDFGYLQVVEAVDLGAEVMGEVEGEGGAVEVVEAEVKEAVP